MSFFLPENSLGNPSKSNKNSLFSGLYIYGNMALLQKCSPIWKKINEKLEEGENIGPTLPYDESIY